MSARERVEELLARHEKVVSPVHAAVLVAAEIGGAPLDPERFDDAALILRAETLIESGLGVRQALARAREELQATRAGDMPPSAADDAVVYCPICKTDKRFVVEAGLAYPRCGHRPFALRRTAAANTTEP